MQPRGEAFAVSALPAPAAFRDAAAGWVARGIAAPFVRVLEVRDAAHEELAAHKARRAASL